MKVAIVTWTLYSNYGTYLQSYALQKYIERLGYENCIISDRSVLQNSGKTFPSDIQNHIERKVSGVNESLGTRLKNLLRNPGRIKRILLARLDYKKYQKPYIESRAEFDRFRNSELKILEWDSFAAKESLNEQFDVFVCGSDQIWSVFEDKFNPYYFLDFVKKPKIAYGPSLGTDRIPDAIREKIKMLLEDFSAISVREELSAEQLTDLTGKKVKSVVDPTLLLEQDFWERFSANGQWQCKKQKYLLCYFLENKSWYFTFAERLAKRLRLKIVLIPSRYEFISSSYITKEVVSPRNFVSWIQHASYVLTDSYHGCIFSIIFKKNFYCLQRFAGNDPFSQNIRIQSLFSRLNMNDRILTEEKNSLRTLPDEINYTAVNLILEPYRRESGQYLKHALELQTGD